MQNPPISRRRHLTRTPGFGYICLRGYNPTPPWAPSTAENALRDRRDRHGLVRRFGVHGVKLLGEVPRSLPIPSLPAVRWDDLGDLLPLALACFFLGAVVDMCPNRSDVCREARLPPHSNQEFLALAGANLASGLGHGFPVSGGVPQSLVNESSGTRTPLSGLPCTIKYPSGSPVRESRRPPGILCGISLSNEHPYRDTGVVIFVSGAR